MPWMVPAAIVGSAAIGAGSSKKAGKQASSAAEDAANKQLQMYQQTRADLSPFTQAGAGVLPALNALALSGPTGGGPDYVAQAAQNVPLQMTQAQLEQTPGYQWMRDQGIKATQSAAAARGLGVSGAALKGAATYATGLADQTYQKQFDMQQARFKDYLDLNTGQGQRLQQQYARLHETASLGESAASGTGTAGTAAASAAGSYLNAAGVDTANASRNTGNALSGGFNDLAGYLRSQNALLPANYGTQVGTTGLSASGNPVMTGFAAPYVPGQVAPGGFTAA